MNGKNVHEKAEFEFFIDNNLSFSVIAFSMF